MELSPRMENALRLLYLLQIRRAYETGDFSHLYGAIDEECIWGASQFYNGVRGKDAVIERLQNMAKDRSGYPETKIVRAINRSDIRDFCPLRRLGEYYLHFCMCSKPGDFGMLEYPNDPRYDVAAFWRLGVSPQGKILYYIDDTPMGQWH